MKKTALLLTSLSFLFFSVIPAVHAEAIYLKNGRLMTGKIVEKNEKYLVLRSGTGEAIVRTTIFLEDINRIESDDGHVQGLVSLPPGLLTAELQASGTSKIFSSTADSGATGVDRIKNLLEENRQVSSSLVLSTESEKKSPEGTASNVTEALVPLSGDTQKKKDQGISFVLPAVRSGNGIISGMVSLPPLANAPKPLKKAQGDLYVYLMENTESGQNLLTTWVPYFKIEALDVSSRQVSYRIGHVPAGTYHVFAQWHITPSDKNAVEAGPDKTWGFIGTNGDYMGVSKETIVLAPNEERRGIDIDCSILLQANKSISPEAQEKIQIKDLYYQRLSSQEARFILLVKNNSDKPADLFGLEILINDERILGASLPQTFIGAQKEQEVDVTAVYEAYKKDIQKKGSPSSEESLKTIRFKIIKRGTGEVEFEKALFIP
jgi:hypothetical protein